MNKLEKLFASTRLVLLLLLVVVLPTLIPLTNKGYFPTQDYIYIARVYQMDKALGDGHFPVRWVPDFRYGEPLYNFYAPFPYYVGALIHRVGNIGFNLSYIDTVKILLALGFILSAASMFFLAKEFFGNLGGFLAALLYTYAPYHSVDVYVRGALSEGWALIFFPLIFLTSLKLVKNINIKNAMFLAISLAGLFYTHNVMTMLFSPFVLAWFGFLVWKERSIKLIFPLLLSFVWGVGLAASFLLPAFFEKQYVQTDHLTLGYFDFRGHFVTIGQFFSTFWGYGASLWGPKDDMSFQVGLNQWLLIGLSLVLGIIYFRKKNKEKEFLFFPFFLGSFLLSLFMQHNKSAFLWEKFPVMWFTQFPWRFLGISIFFSALAGSFVYLFLNDKIKYILTIFLSILIITLGVGFFHPENYYLDSIDEHYIGKEVLSVDDKLPKDYLPIWVKVIQKEKIDTPHFKDGQGEVSGYTKKTDFVSFKVNSKDGGVVEVPLTYFPGWIARLNDRKVDLLPTDGLGLVKLSVPAGSSDIKLSFEDTSIRFFSNYLSLGSILILLILFLKIKYENK